MRVGLGSRSEGRLVEGGKWNVGLEGEGEGVRMDGFMVYLSLSLEISLSLSCLLPLRTPAPFISFTKGRSKAVG